MTNDQTVANGVLGSYKVKTIKDADGNNIQVIALASPTGETFTGTALPDSKLGIDIGSLPVWATTGQNSLNGGSTATVLNVNINGGTTPITAQPYDLIVVDEDGGNPRMTGTVLSTTTDTITLTSPLPYTPTDFPTIYTLTPTFLTANQAAAGGYTSLNVALANALPAGSNNIGTVGQAGDWTVAVSAISPVSVTELTRAVVGSFSAVSVTTSSTLLADATSGHAGVAVMNTDASKILYVAYGFAASTTNYSVAIAPGGYLEVPDSASQLDIFAVAASGTITANVTTMET